MHYTKYNQVCSKCDSPIEYKELGRSIIITPCPCQVAELVKLWQMTLKAAQSINTKYTLSEFHKDIERYAKLALAKATK